MKKVVFFSLLMVIGLSSCVKNSSEYKALQAQRDSLAIVSAQNTAELEDILSLLNDVEENFREIKSAENYLSVQSSTPGEMSSSVRENIKSNMQFITETLQKNREQIAELEKKLKGSSIKSDQLQASIQKLKEELEQKTEAVAVLQDELQRKNYEISRLNKSVTDLVQNVTDLEAQSEVQKTLIEQQKAELIAAYFCYGTSKELKEQKILDGGKLGTNLSYEYFTKIADLNQFTVLPLYAKKGKMISKHPDGSYEFVKDENNKVVLKILDPKSFWSLTKYLVIEVNL